MMSQNFMNFVTQKINNTYYINIEEWDNIIKYVLDDYVKSITYDAATNSLTIVDQDDNEIVFSAATHEEVEAVADRVDDIEAEIQEGTSAANPLTNKDYVDNLIAETGHTHANKAILDEITQEDLDQIDTNAQSITDILNGTSIDSFGDVETALSGKENTINDLADIRAGATLGATAVQP